MAEKLTEMTKQKLDTTGSYLVDTMLAGVLECHMVSAQGRARVQLLLSRLTQQIRQGDEKFRKEISEVNKGQDQQQSAFAENYVRQMQKSLEMIAQLMDRGSESNKRLANQLAQSMQAYRKTMQEMSAKSGIDQNFVDVYFQASENIVAAINNVIKTMGDDDVETLALLTGRPVHAALQHNPGNNQFALFGQQADDSQASAAPPALPKAPASNGGQA